MWVNSQSSSWGWLWCDVMVVYIYCPHVINGLLMFLWETIWCCLCRVVEARKKWKAISRRWNRRRFLNFLSNRIWSAWSLLYRDGGVSHSSGENTWYIAFSWCLRPYNWTDSRLLCPETLCFCMWWPSTMLSSRICIEVTRKNRLKLHIPSYTCGKVSHQTQYIYPC